MANDSHPRLRRISADEFVSRLLLTAKRPDAAFAFFLGAGCSIACRIPGTAKLVQGWLLRLHELRQPGSKGPPSDEWVRSLIPEWDSKSPGAAYGRVIQELFLTPEERQREIDFLCSGKKPRFGYAVLAALMSDQEDFRGRFNVVLTSNFDDLLQDALIRFDRPKPLVIHHDALAGFIRPTRTRPLIVKVHGDHSLSPKNTKRETEQLQESIQQSVRGLLHDRGLIFLGYGGNDQSIQQLLEGLSEEALPFGVFWVGGAEPRGNLAEWLKKREAIWVEYHDFDLLMDKIHRKFDRITVPDHDHKKLIEKLFDKFESMTEPERSEILGKAAGEMLLRTDPVFFPSLAAYAGFLDDYGKDFETAGLYYAAITKEYAHDAEILGNYADFLERTQKDSELARHYYERAIVANPDEFHNLGNYAGFLEQHNEFGRAREYYSRAASAVDSRKLPDDWVRFWLKAYTLDLSDSRLVPLGNLKSFVRGRRTVSDKFGAIDSRWAKKHRHPGSKWIDKLVQVLKGDLKQSELKAWTDWKRATRPTAA